MGSEQRPVGNIFTNPEVFRNLESGMVTYRDLLGVPVKENNQRFIGLNSLCISNGYMPVMSDMEAITGSEIQVREEVGQRLQMAQSLLQATNPNYSLFVTYGYRSLDVQTKKFLEQVKNASNTFFENPLDLYEEAHRFIAVPTVAGHPTGGAVDVLITDKETDTLLDFGGDYCDFTSKNCYTFFPDINVDARQNRLLLRSSMMQAGFAPFDGEWWHFSYGDREWAYFYKKPYAVYQQQSLEKGGLPL